MRDTLESIYGFFKELFDPVGHAIIGNYVPASSSYAEDIDSLIGLITVIVGFWFLLTMGTFFYFLFKYRRKDGVRAMYVTGKEPHLWAKIHRPHMVILVCDVLIVFMAIFVWFKIKQELPQADLEVEVIAQQWAWQFVHPGPDRELGTDDDIRTSNELHVEVGQTYHYKLVSLDVLHDFSVPVFRLKQDAIPGRVITGWFKPTRTGEHDIQCAEMCGIGHGIMGARIFIETPEEHTAWVAENAPAVKHASNTPLPDYATKSAGR